MKHYQKSLKRGLSLLALTTGLSPACSNPGKSSSPQDPDPQVQIKESADAKPIVPAKPEAAPRIVMSFKSASGLKNISGYVVNAIDEHAFKPVIDSPGRYALNSMKAGRFDIIIEAQKASDDASQSASTAVAIRINGISIKSTEDTVIKDPIELLPTLTIKGKIHLHDGVTHGAINVQIPGTRIKAVTAADGSYALERVPSGMHDVAVTNAGFGKGIFEVRSWPEGSNELSTLTLLPEEQALPTGVHYKGEGLSATEPNTVTLFLLRPMGMAKFRWSETSDFVGSLWQDYQSSFDANLPAGGDRRVFVQFASKDLSQLSAVFNVDLPTAPLATP